MEDQENAHYTVFLELEKQVVMDLERRNTFLIALLEPIIPFRTRNYLLNDLYFSRTVQNWK